MRGDPAAGAARQRFSVGPSSRVDVCDDEVVAA
jgi:hypothetical protein